MKPISLMKSPIEMFTISVLYKNVSLYLWTKEYIFSISTLKLALKREITSVICNENQPRIVNLISSGNTHVHVYKLLHDKI